MVFASCRRGWHSAAIQQALVTWLHFMVHRNHSSGRCPAETGTNLGKIGWTCRAAEAWRVDILTAGSPGSWDVKGWQLCEVMHTQGWHQVYIIMFSTPQHSPVQLQEAESSHSPAYKSSLTPRLEWSTTACILKVLLMPTVLQTIQLFVRGMGGEKKKAVQKIC